MEGHEQVDDQMCLATIGGSDDMSFLQKMRVDHQNELVMLEPTWLACKVNLEHECPCWLNQNHDIRSFVSTKPKNQCGITTMPVTMIFTFKFNKRAVGWGKDMR